ncbi:hypothetical protein Btru_029474 [Bulinus truncatus]|nr:hypothetical protein Btru_029474 [Bulinus truncatus]
MNFPIGLDPSEDNVTDSGEESFSDVQRAGSSHGSVAESLPPNFKVTHSLYLDLNITKLLKDSNDGECLKVVNNPGSYWRSPRVKEGDALFTAQRGVERMTQAIRCGILDEEYLTTPPVPELYPFEKFYLSHPPLVDVMRATSENHSSVTLLGPRIFDWWLNAVWLRGSPFYVSNEIMLDLSLISLKDYIGV